MGGHTCFLFIPRPPFVGVKETTGIFFLTEKAKQRVRNENIFFHPSTQQKIPLIYPPTHLSSCAHMLCLLPRLYNNYFPSC